MFLPMFIFFFYIGKVVSRPALDYYILTRVRIPTASVIVSHLTLKMTRQDLSLRRRLFRIAKF